MNVRAVLLASTLCLSSCVAFSFDRDLRNVPLPDGAIESLQPGDARLEQCLERLGAPLFVWEYKGDGVALAYGWSKEKNWNVTVSVPVTRGYSTSFSYTDDSANLRGAVLLFDRDLKLEIVRHGFLRSLRAELAQKRPAAVDQKSAPDSGDSSKADDPSQPSDPRGSAPPSEPKDPPRPPDPKDQ